MHERLYEMADALDAARTTMSNMVDIEVTESAHVQAALAQRWSGNVLIAPPQSMMQLCIEKFMIDIETPADLPKVQSASFALVRPGELQQLIIFTECRSLSNHYMFPFLSSHATALCFLTGRRKPKIVSHHRKAHDVASGYLVAYKGSNLRGFLFHFRKLGNTFMNVGAL